jgi:hypothetical protein
MTKTPEELLAIRFGGASVAENIETAIKSGKLIRNGDGTLEFPERSDRAASGSFLLVKNAPPLGCHFLLGFLFQTAYAESAVPYGCSACYKIKVLPRTLRELVAAWQIAKRVDCLSKWGIDLGNPFSQNVYAGYMYVSGLDTARVFYNIMRQAMDSDPKLGPDVPMVIKRGCSEYEATLGPSDRYEFAPEMAELEALLIGRFKHRKVHRPKKVVVADWIDFAFRIGDDTYLDFTGGMRLRPKTVTYDP